MDLNVKDMNMKLFILLVIVSCMLVWYKTDDLFRDPPEVSTISKPIATPIPKITKKVKEAKKKTSRTVKRVRVGTDFKYSVQLNTPSKRYARGLVSATQYSCLHELWMRESGWSPTSDNPTSSAYGIPQILGLDPSLTPQQQVDRGLSYIRHRYGTPCAAWGFWRNHRWY
jgi:hypothetical protein